MSAVPRSIVGLALVGLGALVIALVLGRSSDTKDDADRTETVAPTPPPSAPIVVQPSTPAPGSAAAPTTGSAAIPVIEDVMRARTDTSVDGTIVLLTALDSRDPVVVAEAASGLVSRGAVAALPVLVDHDVIGRPWAAPSIIDAMGRLASVAPPEQRTEAVERLIALMREEKLRGAQESQGNLLQIYEALGLTGDPKAVPPLEQELADPSVPTAPKLVVVQALVALRSTSSRPVLERLASQLVTAPSTDSFEAELRRDLLAAIREALVKLS